MKNYTALLCSTHAGFYIQDSMVQNVDALRALQFNFLKTDGPDNNKSNRIAKKGKR